MTPTPDSVAPGRARGRLASALVAAVLVAFGLGGSATRTASAPVRATPPHLSACVIAAPPDPSPARHAVVTPAPHGGGKALRVLAKAGDAAGRWMYAEMVRRIARRYSVEWKLVMAIIASESGGDPAAVSPAGAVGLMQLMPDTARELGVNPWDPEQNVEGAVRYLSSLRSTFGSVDLTLVAYNAGPAFAMRYRDGAVDLDAETRAFLVRVGDLLQ